MQLKVNITLDLFTFRGCLLILFHYAQEKNEELELGWDFTEKQGFLPSAIWVAFQT
jgi:hypothetical protein